MQRRQDWLRESLAQAGEPILNFVGSAHIEESVRSVATRMRVEGVQFDNRSPSAAGAGGPPQPSRLVLLPRPAHDLAYEVKGASEIQDKFATFEWVNGFNMRRLL